MIRKHRSGADGIGKRCDEERHEDRGTHGLRFVSGESPARFQLNNKKIIL